MRQAKKCKRTTAFDARRLEQLRKAREAGVLIAIPAALFYCAKHMIQPPIWVTKNAADFMCAMLNPNRRSFKRGRSAYFIHRYQRDTIDLARWETVDDIRERRLNIRENLDDLRKEKGRAARRLRKEEDDMARHIGEGPLSIYEAASEHLDGTPAEGGAEAIKKAYYRANAILRDPTKKWRYHRVGDDFLRQAGIYVDTSGNHSKVK